MNIAFIGCGNVGAPLADHLQKAGHQVTLATNKEASATVEKALSRNKGLRAEETEQAVKNAEVVYLATPFSVVESVLSPLKEALKGKTLVDCTNPVGPGLSHGLGSVTSGSEKIQTLLPETHVVKAFTIYGFENFENPVYPGYSVKPVMMYCGNHGNAKQVIAKHIEQLQFEPLDVGGLEQALHLEHMILLWVRMVRMKGHSPHMVWAALRRLFVCNRTFYYIARSLPKQRCIWANRCYVVHSTTN